MIIDMLSQLIGGIKMKVEHYVNILHENGFRELGYFSGLRTFLGCDILITVEDYRGGYQVSIDSVPRNIGEIFYCQSDIILCEVLEEYLCK